MSLFFDAERADANSVEVINASSKEQAQTTTTCTCFLRFPFSNFRYSLTLFSKFFASFPHGTCTLSVYHQYLALDGIYHPIRAAVPNNSTRRMHMLRHGTVEHERECHPLRYPVPRNFVRRPCQKRIFRPQFDDKRRFTS